MRKLAEQSVEQAQRAFEGFVNAAHQAVSEVQSRAHAAQTGTRDVGQKAMSFAERNVAASFEFAQKLVRARDVEEVMRLQKEYIQAQIQALNEQAKDLGQTATRAAMDAARPKF
ncbi:MAG: phasin family protein [Pseudomonadota bacterium]|nr:phasin family protein [Pseudomonadota bacterium]